MRVERVLDEFKIAGNLGRVVFVLTMAKSVLGIPQKDVVAAMAVPKDVVSKLVGPLVQAGLLTQEREGTNSRIKRLAATDAGRVLLSRVNAALQPPCPTKQEPEQKHERLSFFD